MKSYALPEDEKVESMEAALFHNNEVNQDLEDGEIIDGEDDTEILESSKQITEPKLFKKNHGREGTKEKDFESQWEMEQRSQHHQNMLRVPSSNTFAGFDIRPRVDWFPKNKEGMMKRDVSYLTDDDGPRRKRRKFDQVEEKDSMLRNNQHGMFNRRKNNDMLMEAVEGVNDENMSYARGNSPDVPNFKQYAREFENERQDFRSRENFVRRGRGRRDGCDMDRRGRGMTTKRRIVGGSVMKNNRSEDKEKICQYFLQGKCLNENNCTYSHQQPSGWRMKLCKFYLMDCCSKEDKCKFMHSEFPCKYYNTGMEYYSVQNCRFSRAKLDEEQKKIFSRTNKNKIPSLLEMQIPIPPGLKRTAKNIDDDLKEANNNDYPLLDDLSDDDEFNDLVIYEEKLLPKKQKELLKRIQVQQQLYNETDMSDDPDQEEQYSINNGLNSLHDEKEQSCKPSSSKVEKVDLGQITISDDMAKLLNIIRAIGTGKSTSSASPIYGNSNVVELRKSDVDLRQLTFQFPVAAAAEIDASLDSHPPMKYRLYPAQGSVTEYSKIPSTMGIDVPRGIQMIPGYPRQMQRFDVDPRINNINYY